MNRIHPVKAICDDARPGWGPRSFQPQISQASAPGSGGMTPYAGDWDVEQVVAHLTAAASLSQRRWLLSMPGAPFRPDVHNQRRLAEYRGSTPAETLDRFRAVITSTTAPSGHTGPLVTGSTLALVMSMAGRVAHVADLDGPGVPTLRSRLQAGAA
jgi:hypothetical protein